MAKLLENKVALITGASRGIGNAIARRFAEEGAQVAFTYLSSVEKGLELERELQAMGVKAKGYRSNAAFHTAATELIDAVVTDFGRIDILVNNAGITRDNLLLRMSEEQWDEVINTNLKSVFNLTKGVLKPMLKQRSGSIINISSVVGVMGNAGQSNYAASKAGVIGFSKSIAQEVGSRSIRCNVIAPGFIATDMTHVLDENTKKTFMEQIPLKRLGEGKEVADAAVFLGSDMSVYITGQTLSVCGGML
jgi:3-oxoacyl-[acyl-carrier protein] reductase